MTVKELKVKFDDFQNKLKDELLEMNVSIHELEHGLENLLLKKQTVLFKDAQKREILLGDIPDEYLIQLQKRPYILHKGLLALAHAHGIESIDTEMLKWENDEAIFMATAIGTRGRYTGIGDASPKNVTHNLRTACIRMAETRAVNRCLRLYLGIGITSFDELPDLNPKKESKSKPTDMKVVFDSNKKSSTDRASKGQPEWVTFLKAIRDVGVELDDLNKFCVMNERQLPEEMSHTRRGMMLEWIKNGGAAKVNDSA